MRIATMVLCKYMTEYLQRVVKNCLKWSEHVLIMNSKKDWPGIHSPIEDMTRHIFEHEIKNGGKTHFVSGHWRTEESQRNVGLEMLSDFDWVFIIEADEFLLPTDFKLFKGILRPDRTCYLAKPMIEYWKDENHVMDPLRTYEPIFCVNPRKVRFYDKRCASVLPSEALKVPIHIHHMSYCFPDEKMEWKMKNWWDSNNGTINYNWYEEKWKKWDFDNNIGGLYMSHPEWNTKAAKAVPPNELVEALKK